VLVADSSLLTATSKFSLTGYSRPRPIPYFVAGTDLQIHPSLSQAAHTGCAITITITNAVAALLHLITLIKSE